MKTMKRGADILATALAPAIWGSTYIVTTGMLPQGYPLTVAMLRALPAGILLLLWGRRLPGGIWWLRRSEEHTSEIQSLMRISYAVFCLKKKKTHHPITQ